MTDNTNTHRSLRFKPESILFLGFLCLYVVTISKNLAIAHDSSMYLYWIEHDIHLYMPHHLLYTISMQKWLSFVQLFFPMIDRAFAVSIPNVIAGSASILLIYRILAYRAQTSTQLALLGATGAGVSFGFWFYSVTVEVYLIPLCFLLLAFYLASRSGLNTRDAILIGVIHSLGVLFHQAHVLLYPVLLATIYLANRSNGTPVWKLLLAYTVSSGALTILAYLLVLLLHVQASTIDEAWKWLTLYSHEMPDTWQGLTLATLAKASVGFGRALIGSHFMFAIPSLQDRIMSALKGHWFNDEIFLVSDVSAGFGIVLACMSLAAITILAYLIVKSIFFARKVKFDLNNTTIGLFIWLAVYTCFFFFWDPTNCEFWIPQAVCLWMILAIAVNRFSSKATAYAFAISIILFGLVNFFGSILWAQSKDYDYYYQGVRPFASAPAVDAVVLSNSWTERMYFDHYSPMRHEAMDEMFTSVDSTQIIEEVQQKLTDLYRDVTSKGGRVYILPDAVMMPETALDLAHTTQQNVDKVWEKFDGCLIPRVINGKEVFELKCTP